MVGHMTKKMTSLFFNISLFPQSTLYRKNVVLGERFRKAPCSLDQNAVSLWMAGQGVENKMCFHIYLDWCGCSQRICEKGAKKFMLLRKTGWIAESKYCVVCWTESNSSSKTRNRFQLEVKNAKDHKIMSPSAQEFHIVSNHHCFQA